MAPVVNAKPWVQEIIRNSPFVMFSKTTCPFCLKLKAGLDTAGKKYAAVEIDTRENTMEIQQALQSITNSKTVPQVFVRGAFIGGSTEALKALETGDLDAKLKQPFSHDYDLVVIGGGSGGLAASKEAAELGAKVAVLDFVKPTPYGTKWGLGGTCVNVGCIPKKLMHQAALLQHGMQDAKHFGWQLDEQAVKHDWAKMVENVQGHIRSLNWGYKVSLQRKEITYLNAYGHLVDANTIKCVDASGKESTLTARHVILATGERPRYPDVPGARECCITSDDIFSLGYNPGKTLVVGASYVALECAGFLAAMGNDVTVMVRSILLRGFDQQMANAIGDYMEQHGVKFVKECVPKCFTQIRPVDKESGAPGRVRVQATPKDGSAYDQEFDTVLLAIGRDPCTKDLNTSAVNLELDKVGRVVCDDAERSSVENIFAIGDIVSGKLQLTPVAIEAGRNLARRLYAGSDVLTDYKNVATTVFTPLEYGAIGLAEEDAIAKYGQSDIEVFHSYQKPLEWSIAGREDNVCYAKLVCVKSLNDRVVGFHYLGPNAGEVTQGFALGMRLKATKEDFDRIIGIHPTCAEVFTTLTVTKSSGAKATAEGC